MRRVKQMAFSYCSLEKYAGIFVLTAHVCTDEKSDEALNGEDKSESGADTQNSEGNAEEEDRLRTNCYYDKSKSFFDNISCDDTRSDHMQHTFNMSLNL